MYRDGSESVAARPVALLVNGPSSSGKSTLCRALQERLTEAAVGTTFASVAFDDVVQLISDTLFPISFVALAGGKAENGSAPTGRISVSYTHLTLPTKRIV